MERRPLMEILEDMAGTDKELDLVIQGEGAPIEVRNVVSVEPLTSSAGIRIETRQNYIWVDAGHVSAAWQVRTDL